MSSQFLRILFAVSITFFLSLPNPGLARAEIADEEEDEFDRPSAFDVALEADEAGFASMPEPTVSADEFRRLMARVEQAEARVAALQGDYPVADGEKPPGHWTGWSLQQRWEQVRDPSIITVDQQTRKPGGKEEPKKWYDRLSIRGYAQFRMNTTLNHDEGGGAVQHVGDRSVGENQSYIIRRARLIVSGDVSDRMYVYLQPDFASNVPGSPDANQFTQIRDWYADLYLDHQKVYRVRIGQSKVPFGWENLQSSSNRLPLDRNDAMNSAVRNERDLGVFFYYTPEYIQDLFKEVLDDGLKGSGNYGMIGVGVHNGQGGSFVEQNDDVHMVARFAYPFRVFSDQIAEVGVQGYTGHYVVLGSSIRPRGVGAAVVPAGTLNSPFPDRKGHLDERVAGTFVWYPKPFGFQSEWTLGTSPALDDLQREVHERKLSGGYVMGMYRYVSQKHGTFIPFARWNRYQGGYKAERNAPYVLINEFEAGTEWQINDQMEFTAMYTVTDRTNTTALSGAGERSYQQFEGELLRMQFQVNY